MDGELVSVVVHDHEHLEDPTVPGRPEVEDPDDRFRLVRRDLDAHECVFDSPPDVVGTPSVTASASRHEHE